MAASERKWLTLGVALIAIVMVTVTVRMLLRTVKSTDTNGQGDGAIASSQLELVGRLKDPVTRDATIRGLKEKKDPAIVDILVGLSHKSKESEVRAACLTALGEIGAEKGVHALTIGSRDTDSAVRLAAVGALGKILNRTSYSALGDALTDLDGAVREEAAAVLAAAPGDSVVIQNLIKAFGKDPSIKARRSMALALGKYKSDNSEQEERARQELIRALGTEAEATVRLAALDALLAVDDQYRVKGIVCAIADEDTGVRARARDSLKTLTRETVPMLESALKSPEFGGVVQRSPRGREAVLDVVALLDGLAAPETWGSLLQLVELQMGADRSGKLVLSEPGRRAMDAIAKRGEPVLDPVTKLLLQMEVPMLKKQVAAEVLAAVGAPSVKRIRDYIVSWKVLPSAEEARLWTSVLTRISGPEAEEVAKLVRERDPAVAFAKVAESPVESPAVPAAGVAVEKSARKVPLSGGFDGELLLILRGSVYCGNPPSAYAKRSGGLPWEKKETEKKEEVFKPSGRTDLWLNLAAEGGVWDRIFGYGMNQGVHMGHVAEATVNGNSMTLLLKIGIGSDPWLVGGYGEYKVTLERGADGKFTGSYRGKSRELPIEGKAEAAKKPGRPPVAGDFRPVMPGEHPRMLFRSRDLPRVRARLNTPLGRAAFERFSTSNDPTLLGMAYQLTGDPRYAEKAIPTVKSEMANHDFGFRDSGRSGVRA